MVAPAFTSEDFRREFAWWNAKQCLRFDADEGAGAENRPPGAHIAEFARRVSQLDAAGRGAFAEMLRSSLPEIEELSDDASRLLGRMGLPARRALAALVAESDDDEETLAELLGSLVRKYSDEARAAATTRVTPPAPAGESSKRALCSEAEPCGDPDCPRHEARTDNVEIDWAKHDCDPEPPHTCFRTDAQKDTKTMSNQNRNEDPESRARREFHERNRNANKRPLGVQVVQQVSAWNGPRTDATDAPRADGCVRSPADAKRRMNRNLQNYSRTPRGGGEAA